MKIDFCVAGVGVQEYLITPKVKNSIDRLAKEFNIEKIKSTTRNTLIMAKNEAIKLIRYNISNSQHSILYNFEKAIENVNIEIIIKEINIKYNVTLDIDEIITAVKKSVDSY